MAEKYKPRTHFRFIDGIDREELLKDPNFGKELGDLLLEDLKTDIPEGAKGDTTFEMRYNFDKDNYTVIATWVPERKS